MSVFKAQELLDKYVEGASVTAYYDSSNPSNSFLIKHRTTMPLFLLGMGGLSTLVSGSRLVTRITHGPS
ncbi:MAG: hypothetical protein ABEJ26_10260 [Halosimplex sp.]